ncbi:glycoside hydrolase family 3 protein [Streptomyces sp. RB6PN25]|uniref:beta-N-acetylhexosaminidase n=1 Tax=Streptomyces humicola TaxID=2953240 RepID=A0ABT1PZ26_9ACTN|nr:glycoside hydrolase family 3 N-terminal domain-containing protein [Streptomyces humicola]MCQ4082373.1 glycoside hydrolase family 3 protein [Streptomyces humicola]
MCAPKPSSSDRNPGAIRPRVTRLGTTAAALGLLTALTGCGGGQTHPATSTPSHPVGPGTSSLAGTASTAVTSTSTTPHNRSPQAGIGHPGTPPAQACINTALAGMPEAQRVGQLFMVGVSSSGISAAQAAALRRADVGAVQLTGRSTAGTKAIRSLTDRLQALATPLRGATARLLVATDQEGGNVQVLRGPGFSAIPSAVVQGQWPDARVQSQAADWGRQLRAAGVTMNLAPVADTVPPGGAAVNAPIGALSREYGSNPATVAGHSTAFLRGMTDAGVLATLKHFPGLGRVRGNTDLTANVTDNQTTRNDPYLQPFRNGIQAGAPFVMASLATYTRIDPAHQAAFSSTVLRGVLRGTLGFRGVVISDDLGNAVAVKSIPAGQRALRFLGAGGDMVLTDDPGAIGPMTSAVLAQLPKNAALRADVDASVRRILTAKQNAGLLTCQG